MDSLSTEDDTKAAMRYYLQNSARIDVAQMMRQFATSEPTAFNAFICGILKTTTPRLAGLLAKKEPATFLRLAQHENRHFEAASAIVKLMKQGAHNKVQVIKNVREVWGHDLKEALDVVNAMHAELIVRNFLPDDGKERTTYEQLDDRLMNAYFTLSEHFDG